MSHPFLKKNIHTLNGSIILFIDVDLYFVKVVFYTEIAWRMFFYLRGTGSLLLFASFFKYLATDTLSAVRVLVERITKVVVIQASCCGIEVFFQLVQNLMDSMDSTEGLRQKPGQSLKDFIELIESHYIQSKECTNENFIQEKKEALWFGLDLELWELVDPVLNVQDNIQLDDQVIPVSWEELVETAQDAEWLVKLKKEKESPSCYVVNEPFTVSTEDSSFNRDADGYVRIYIGGSAGIWFGRGHPL